MGHITNRLNSLKDLFRDNNITSPPTDAAYAALMPGYTTMQLRRTFGSKSRAYSLGLIKARETNPAPTVANPIADAELTEATTLNFTFNTNVFADADGQTLTYSATLADGSALPEWITFTAGTRNFGGTVPAFADDEEVDVITIRLTATDPYGKFVYDDFTYTIVAAG